MVQEAVAVALAVVSRDRGDATGERNSNRAQKRRNDTMVVRGRHAAIQGTQGIGTTVDGHWDNVPQNI